MNLAPAHYIFAREGGGLHFKSPRVQPWESERSTLGRFAFSGPYRQPYACFHCRKPFHATMEWDRTKRRDMEFLCPECKQPMHSMGPDFQAPRKHDVQQWRKVKMLYDNSFAYHSCGCGAGHRPKRLSEVEAFLRDTAKQREKTAAANRRIAKNKAQEAKRQEREARKPKKVHWEFYPVA